MSVLSLITGESAMLYRVAKTRDWTPAASTTFVMSPTHKIVPIGLKLDMVESDAMLLTLEDTAHSAPNEDKRFPVATPDDRFPEFAKR